MKRTKQIRVACWTSPYKDRGQAHDISVNAEEALRAIESLHSFQPDLICLPENFLCAGVRYANARAVALADGHPLLAQFSAFARDHSVQVALPFLEEAGGTVFNSLTVFARDGSRLGTYRKRLLWPSNQRFTEFEYGVAPGLTSPIIDTEAGPVGVQICIEVNWSAGWAEFREKDVRLILYPSEQRAGAGLHYRAWEAQSFILAAVSKGGPSCLISPMGKTIAQWGPESPQPVADIGLDYEFVHLDYNDNKLRNLRAQFGGEVRICEYEDERICLVTSLDPSLSAADMLAQGGIVPLRNYLSNIRGACENSQAANRVYAAGMAGEKR